MNEHSLVLTEPWSGGVSVLFRIERLIARARTSYQEVLIADTEAYGRTLFIDGLVQSTESDEALYHEPFVHPGMIVHGAARRVLLAGVGEGACLREILRHDTVTEVIAVDIDREIVTLCREHLPDWSHGAFDDPRLELRFEDIQDTLRATSDRRFDVIVLDITDPVESGPAVDLFTVRFFREISRVLADDGLLILQAGELDPQDLASARVVRSTLAAAFPWVHFGQMFLPSFHALWAVALAGKRSFELDPPDLEQRIARLARHDLRVYSPNVHRSTLEVPRYLRALLEQSVPAVTGDDSQRHVAFRSGGPDALAAASGEPEAEGTA